MSNDEACKTESSFYSAECEDNIIENYTIDECESEEIYEASIAKVAAIIGEFTVQVDLESKLKLPEPALEIKRIKKNVLLTECRVIKGARKVFLKGFVRKNIEYATISAVTPKGICGDIKHTTVHVPFQCTAEVKSLEAESVSPNAYSGEINYFNEQNVGVNTKERDLISSESFNEKIYCELEHSSIYEVNIIEDAKPVPYHPIEREFQCFVEKEVVHLTLKLLQDKQVGKEYIESDELCDS